MKCTWMGQAGLLFDFDGVKVMVDPYLSDSAQKVNPALKRQVAVDESFYDVRPDFLILTHDHVDHTDPETLEKILGRQKGICVLASQNAWQRVRKFSGDHNYVMFDRGTQWTQSGLFFQAVHAQHSDDFAMGVLITYGDTTCYVTGDTLYHNQVIKDVKETGKKIDVIFLPVNGVGNNVNLTDAARLARESGARRVVPIHFGLFDSICPEEDFLCENKVVPQFYQEIPLW